VNETHFGDATLYLGDCLDVLRTLPDASVDSVVTDPPYGLSFMGKRWDYDVPSVEIWAECLRVLKPGGHLLAFAGTRTQHRMAVRIEDAGFEIRDMLAWLYGSGFPKSHDVSKAIDAQAGAEREVVGSKVGKPGYRNGETAANDVYGDGLGNGTAKSNITAPATEAAKQWDGWGTALKPALEPVTLARKPLAGTVAENVLAHGTGAINVGGCRVEADDGANRARPPRTANAILGGGKGTNLTASEHNDAGRWPANVLHDGSDQVLAHFPDCDSGTVSDAPRGRRNGGFANIGADSGSNTPNGPQYGDTGSAARFFYCAKASKADRNEGCEKARGTAKQGNRPNSPDASGKFPDHDHRPSSGNHHPTVKPTDLMRYLLRLVTPPGGTALDPFMGSGSTGKAALLEHFKFIGIERDPDYLEIAKARIDYIRRSGVQVGLFGEAA